MHQATPTNDRALHHLLLALAGVAAVLLITIIVLELKC